MSATHETPDLSHDEQHYLLAAFVAAPSEWFRPRNVDAEDFSDREIDVIVASLAKRGLMDGQPDCHARLTDRGRREASQLGKLARRDWRKFYKRRRTMIALASTIAALVVVLFTLRLTGLL
jgi:hypothetical protein